ncbi:MAG: alkaline phosphatase PhoX [Dongiaceae bacterium]
MDHSASEFKSELFLIAGDPDAGGTIYGDGISNNGWFACSDNCAVDRKGRLWIATDRGRAQAGFGTGDGLWVADTEGAGRVVSRFFFRCPIGAEATGPGFTPDGTTLFLSIQHPGDGKGSTYENPLTRWPDSSDRLPPRPTVVAITKEDGGEIGS